MCSVMVRYPENGLPNKELKDMGPLGEEYSRTVEEQGHLCIYVLGLLQQSAMNRVA